MNKYRSHTCGELTKKDKDKDISLSGWINKKRDHGNLLFLDLRDNYGVTQCVIENSHKNFKELEKLSLETVIKVEGKVLERSKDTINQDLNTGEIELSISLHEVLGRKSRERSFLCKLTLKPVNLVLKGKCSARRFRYRYCPWQA